MNRSNRSNRASPEAKRAELRNTPPSRRSPAIAAARSLMAAAANLIGMGAGASAADGAIQMDLDFSLHDSPDRALSPSNQSSQPRSRASLASRFDVGVEPASGSALTPPTAVKPFAAGPPAWADDRPTWEQVVDYFLAGAADPQLCSSAELTQLHLRALDWKRTASLHLRGGQLRRFQAIHQLLSNVCIT